MDMSHLALTNPPPPEANSSSLLGSVLVIRRYTLFHRLQSSAQHYLTTNLVFDVAEVRWMVWKSSFGDALPILQPGRPTFPFSALAASKLHRIAAPRHFFSSIESISRRRLPPHFTSHPIRD
ncbi:hypothetical protein Cob_v002226 [Colletotrichum orbiculare MAFF 240422]|uniref:Uncharacterized protein n=1 Tax=Colletotrichum orbiculare (strain 104-T / ATCC 96160 / CBS 514.97 / LARS 414 / MAFF 240422) TaxID=1213857 RepID=A0A484G5E9_COLOR|nr:hypothetical protein Cob_v002226 [Colletotrichum orbiculare MAFF 240422]